MNYRAKCYDIVVTDLKGNKAYPNEHEIKSFVVDTLFGYVKKELKRDENDPDWVKAGYDEMEGSYKRYNKFAKRVISELFDAIDTDTSGEFSHYMFETLEDYAREYFSDELEAYVQISDEDAIRIWG